MFAHTGTDISKLCRSVQKVVPLCQVPGPGVTQEGAVTACDQRCDCCMHLIPVNISSQGLFNYGVLGTEEEGRVLRNY